MINNNCIKQKFDILYIEINKIINKNCYQYNFISSISIGGPTLMCRKLTFISKQDYKKNKNKVRVMDNSAQSCYVLILFI